MCLLWPREVHGTAAAREGKRPRRGGGIRRKRDYGLEREFFWPVDPGSWWGFTVGI
jgi:hypothetical protein